MTGKAVSSPVTPIGASSNGASFSSRECGAWSVAMQSIAPDRRPSISASRSRWARSGGFILNRGSRERTASSVSVRWCGVTSAVIWTPAARDALHRLDRLRGRQVQDVDATVLVPGQLGVALDRRALGDRRDARHPERRRDRSLVHHTVPGQGRILLVQRQHEAREPLVLKRLAHPVSVRDREAVVAEAGRALPRQLRHLAQLGPGLPLGDRGEEADRHDGLDGSPLLERAQHRRRIHDGLRVRHREDRAEAAGRRRARAGLEVLLVLAPRSPEVDVRVDEAGEGRQALGLDLLASRRRIRSTRSRDLGDLAVAHQQVVDAVEAGPRVEQPHAPQEQRRGHRLASRHADAREAPGHAGCSTVGIGAGPAAPWRPPDSSS